MLLRGGPTTASRFDGSPVNFVVFDPVFPEFGLAQLTLEKLIEFD